VVDDLVSEGVAGDTASGEQGGSFSQRRRKTRLVRDVGIADELGFEVETLFDPEQASCEHGRQRQVGVHIGTGHSALDTK